MKMNRRTKAASLLLAAGLTVLGAACSDDADDATTGETTTGEDTTTGDDAE